MPAWLAGAHDGIALRVTAHAPAAALCSVFGGPIVSTSANRHGRPDPVTAAAALHDLEGCVPLVLDGGACPGGVPSTVLDLTMVPPVVRRRGPVTAEQIAEVLGALALDSAP